MKKFVAKELSEVGNCTLEIFETEDGEYGVEGSLSEFVSAVAEVMYDLGSADDDGELFEDYREDFFEINQEVNRYDSDRIKFW